MAVLNLRPTAPPLSPTATGDEARRRRHVRHRVESPAATCRVEKKAGLSTFAGVPATARGVLAAASSRRPPLPVCAFDKLRGHPMYDPSVTAADGQPAADDGQQQGTGAQPDKSRPVRVQASRGGRKGKTVTVITGIPEADLKPICTKLKGQCGSGGAVKGGTIEIQGDHAGKLVQILQDLGYKDSKKSGG